MIISLCGKSGCGKGYICECFKKLDSNIVSIDIDKIGHEVLTYPNVQEALVLNFGEEVVKNGIVDRKALGNIVFNDEEKMAKHTEITWGCMEEIINNFIKENEGKIIILDWQLTPKTDFFKNSDLRILVEAPYELRMEKAILRDNITKEEFLTRDKASYKYDKSSFEQIILNDYTERVNGKVREIYEENIISR